MRNESMVRLMLRVVIMLLAGIGAVVASTNVVRAQQPTPPAKIVPIRVVDSTAVQVIKLRDGSSIVGRTTEVSADSIRFAATGGLLTIARANILEAREVSTATLRRGEVWPANPNATRLLFAPTGRMLGPKEGYFNDTYLFLVSVQGGINSHFNLGGGMSVLPLDDFTDNVLFITPKVGLVASPKFNLAIGGLAGFAGGLVDDGETANFGVVYAVGTVGAPDASISFGTGLAYAGGKFVDRPVAMLGGEARLSRRISFISENYLVPNDDVNSIVSYGLRFFGEKLSADLAFWNIPGEDAVFPGIPYVAFSVKF